MKYILGIDTGGTYTDAVIVDSDTNKIIKKAKALTTKNDLKVGISSAIDALDIKKSDYIGMICLSTTLATNAVVENKISKTGLIVTGGPVGDKTPASCVRLVSGKMDIKGIETEIPSEEEVKKAIDEISREAEAIAVSGYASVRNPSHEIMIKNIAESMTQLPVFCAHELSGNLGFKERTNTTVLNAGLIGIVREFLDATKKVLKEKNISGRLMIVKSDGSLMDEIIAAKRPIETILSGPAASILGAVALTGEDNALLLDMGGTTVDIADYDNGTIKVNQEGTQIAEWRTRVRAVDVSTHGIGGDSLISVTKENITAGPIKAEPVSRVGYMYSNYIDELCEIESMQVSAAKKAEYSIGYIYKGKDKSINNVPHTYWYWKNHSKKEPIFDEMLAVDITPTDILCLNGIYEEQLDVKAARMRIKFLSDYLMIDSKELIIGISEEIKKTIFSACIQSAVDFSREKADLRKEKAAKYLINKMFSEKNTGFLKAAIALKKPIVAVGAPVKAWIPSVAEKLKTEIIIPENAEVANAVGAALGKIHEKAEALVRREKDKRKYYLFLPDSRKVFYSRKSAVEEGAARLKEYVHSCAARAGSSNAEVTIAFNDVFVDSYTGGKKIYIETRITAEAIGKPDF